jgi:hypothetical protein
MPRLQRLLLGSFATRLESVAGVLGLKKVMGDESDSPRSTEVVVAIGVAAVVLVGSRVAIRVANRGVATTDVEEQGSSVAVVHRLVGMHYADEMRANFGIRLRIGSSRRSESTYPVKIGPWMGNSWC